jgi:4-hydroxy-tetrahydrodipicolinate reductase
MRIGVAGIAGRMGRLIAEEAARRGALAGGTLRPGQTPPPGFPFPIATDLAALAGEAEVIIDFTRAETVIAHAETLRRAGRAWVLGTTGLDGAAEEAVREAARHIPVCRAANFSRGVTVMLALAERLGALFPAASFDAEILEMHHRQKIDAPSGTALALGEALARGRGSTLAEERLPPRDGLTGPRPNGGIGFAVLRGGQVVGEHMLLLTSGSEQLILGHRAFDRRLFAEGAVDAAFWLAGRPAGLYSMRDVLGL